jgi:hypothetical protein
MEKYNSCSKPPTRYNYMYIYIYYIYIIYNFPIVFWPSFTWVAEKFDESTPLNHILVGYLCFFKINSTSDFPIEPTDSNPPAHPHPGRAGVPQAATVQDALATSGGDGPMIPIYGGNPMGKSTNSWELRGMLKIRRDYFWMIVLIDVGAKSQPKEEVQQENMLVYGCYMMLYGYGPGQN